MHKIKSTCKIHNRPQFMKMHKIKTTCKTHKIKTTCKTHKIKTTCKTHKIKTTCKMHKIKTTCKTHKIKTTCKTHKIKTSCKTHKIKTTPNLPHLVYKQYYMNNKLDIMNKQNYFIISHFHPHYNQVFGCNITKYKLRRCLQKTVANK